VIWLLTLLACTCASPPERPNILIVLADDIGIEQVGAFGVGANPAVTPTLNRLAEEGVAFREAYAEPVCSSTRASLLTGRVPSATGVGSQVKFQDPGFELRDVPTLAHVLGGAGYATAAFGKWHLNRWKGVGTKAPLEVGGFRRFEGIDTNLLGPGPDGRELTYGSWYQNSNGQIARRDGYHTRAVFRDAIQALPELPEPWFVWLAPAAAHAPFHWPPEDLAPLTPRVDDNRYKAMVESFDTMLGRMLSRIPDDVLERTWVFVLADNGTPKKYAEPPFRSDTAKGTVGEGGIRVPLIVLGPGALPRISDGLVSVRDVHATVLELAGVPSPTDGMSLAKALRDGLSDPPREVLSAHRFEPNGLGVPRTMNEKMVRWDRWKLVQHTDGSVELFDVTADPTERRDIQDEQLDITVKMERLLAERFGAFDAKSSTPPSP